MFGGKKLKDLTEEDIRRYAASLSGQGASKPGDDEPGGASPPASEPPHGPDRPEQSGRRSAAFEEEDDEESPQGSSPSHTRKIAQVIAENSIPTATRDGDASGSRNLALERVMTQDQREEQERLERERLEEEKRQKEEAEREAVQDRLSEEERLRLEVLAELERSQMPAVQTGDGVLLKTIEHYTFADAKDMATIYIELDKDLYEGAAAHAEVENVEADRARTQWHLQRNSEWPWTLSSQPPRGRIRPWPWSVQRVPSCGLCILQDVVQPELLQRCAVQADKTLDSCRLQLEERGIDMETQPFAFREAVHRSKGRFDMQLGPCVACAPVFEPGLLDEAPWLPLIQRVLGWDARHLFTGAVVASPGAEAQDLHMDGFHLFGPDEASTVHCPPHCLTVFVPLVDLTARNGTEYWPGSHLLGKECVGGAPGYVPELSTGSVVLFDYRLIHRGLSNLSDRRRPVLYMVWARSWFNDCINFPPDSLFA